MTPNAGTWQVADSNSISLNDGQNYGFWFSVTNVGDFGAGNPAGFLAELSVTNGASYLTGSDWHVYEGTDPTGGWTYLGTATEYGANDGSAIWSPVAGIDSSAQWIWGPHNFDDPDAGEYPTLSFFTYLTNPAGTAKVPEPATMLLLGFGLLGIAGVSRKKLFK